MNTSTLKKLTKKALSFYDMPEGKFKHFSFIMDGNRPLSFGWNQTRKTHPIAAKYGYRFANIHSELDTIINYLKSNTVEDLHKYTLVNIRLNVFRKVKLSKPCSCCCKLLVAFNIRDVIYSNNDGDFETL